ncbi:hypothetical protein RKE29_17545 [Streptomyces sp. B1866]|uniref:hypothetical protein n=1 Tax=Streptomyces sp. B1866 TaxID=3075431 RepID=UPI0028926E42|nr:hypothetical protein [Streptomyces sp. B1866]MDT3398430.1 hypothetical protein [Streptomyces sp. B1866]
MSEIAGTSRGVHPIRRAGGPASAENVHEAYSFACMRCGHGWEQAYEIEHHVDAGGQAFVVYYAEGARVRSPLTSPTCVNCGEHVVRIMRPGQVSTAVAHQRTRRAPARAAGEPARDGDAPAEGRREHHWLADLLRPFSRHRA